MGKAKPKLVLNIEFEWVEAGGNFTTTVGGGFLIGFITGYAIKKVIKLAAVIVGLFIAELAYL